MNRVAAYLSALLTFMTLLAAADPVRTTADGLTVIVRTDPPIIAVGKAKVRVELKENGQPVTGATVRVFVHMPSMDMGEKEQTARPLPDAPGVYEAPAVFAMAGDYVADITVITGDRQRRAQVKLATGMNTAERAGHGLTLGLVVALAGAALAILTWIGMRRSGQRIPWSQLAKPGVWGSILLLGLAIAVAMYAVRNWRRPGAMTPIEAQAMEMETPPPPGVASVETAVAGYGPVEQTVSYLGQVTGWVEQDIIPRIGGWIVEMPVYVGTRVRRGDVLLRLDRSSTTPVVAERAGMVEQATLEAQAATSEVRRVQADVERARADAAAKQSALAAARSELEQARAEASEAQEAVVAATEKLSAAKASQQAAASDVAYWDAELARMERLRARGVVSLEELQRTQTETARARAALTAAEAGIKEAEAEVRRMKAAHSSALAAVQSASSRLQQARADNDSAAQSLRMTEAGLDTARRQAAARQASVRQARAMLLGAETTERYTIIRATADGVITERRISPGVYVTAGQTVLRMVPLAPVRLQARVSEADLPLVRVGAAVRVWRPEKPDRTVLTRITSVAPYVDDSTRTALVEAVWPNADGRFRAGEAIRMSIVVASRQRALRIPAEAVREEAFAASGVEGRSVKHTVWRVQQGPTATVERVSIRTGAHDERFYEVIEGLQAGDRVVVKGWAGLHNGDEVVDTSAPAAGPMPAGSARSGAATTHQHTTAPRYTCPMHPEVVADAPGRCPKCGMALVRKDTAR